MISSIFGKTKPIIVIGLLSFLCAFYFLVQFYVLRHTWQTWNITMGILGIMALLASIILLDFIVKRNKLGGNNSFVILYFAILVLLFPRILGDPQSLVCNFFLVLALRCILSFKNLKGIRFKVFNATFWVLLASLFHVWALLFLLLVLMAISIYEPKVMANWLALLPAFISFILILYAVFFALDEQQFLYGHYVFTVDMQQWLRPISSLNMKAVIYVLISTILGIFAIVRLGKKGMGKLISYRLLLVGFILGLCTVMLGLGQNSGALVVTFAPAAIFMSGYLESIKRKRVKEVVLAGSILLPCLAFAFQEILY